MILSCVAVVACNTPEKQVQELVFLADIALYDNSPYSVILKLQAKPADSSGYLCEGEFLEI